MKCWLAFILCIIPLCKAIDHVNRSIDRRVTPQIYHSSNRNDARRLFTWDLKDFIATQEQMQRSPGSSLCVEASAKHLCSSVGSVKALKTSRIQQPDQTHPSKFNASSSSVENRRNNTKSREDANVNDRVLPKNLNIHPDSANIRMDYVSELIPHVCYFVFYLVFKYS